VVTLVDKIDQTGVKPTKQAMAELEKLNVYQTLRSGLLQFLVDQLDFWIVYFLEY